MSCGHTCQWVYGQAKGLDGLGPKGLCSQQLPLIDLRGYALLSYLYICWVEFDSEEATAVAGGYESGSPRTHKWIKDRPARRCPG